MNLIEFHSRYKPEADKFQMGHVVEALQHSDNQKSNNNLVFRSVWLMF